MMLTSNQADTDEIYQDVGMTLWKNFDQFTPGTNFQAWARKIAFNRVRNFRRLHHHKTVLCSPRFLETIDQRIAKKSPSLDAQHDALVKCFNKLPERQRALIDERYQPGATPASVARKMGRNVKSVYQALWRIHNSLLDCVRKATLEEGIS
jgi:RNA polymerase sigma-70 factor (ECF subfamily)